MDPVILIFGGFALFIIFKLFSVLGTRTGHEQQRPDLEGIQRAAKGDDVAAAAKEDAAFEPVFDREAGEDDLEDASDRHAAISPLAATLREADPDFDERQFIDGAKAAYEMIVEAFAAGDLKSIRRYLETSVYEAFKSAVTQREEGQFRVDLKFVGTDNASLSAARVEDGAMIATVDFASNQVRATYDRDDNVVDGDPNRVDLVRDRWTFRRPLRANDPNWTLSATGAA